MKNLVVIFLLLFCSGVAKAELRCSIWHIDRDEKTLLRMVVDDTDEASSLFHQPLKIKHDIYGKSVDVAITPKRNIRTQRFEVYPEFRIDDRYAELKSHYVANNVLGFSYLVHLFDINDRPQSINFECSRSIGCQTPHGNTNAITNGSILGNAILSLPIVSKQTEFSKRQKKISKVVLAKRFDDEKLELVNKRRVSSLSAQSPSSLVELSPSFSTDSEYFSPLSLISLTSDAVDTKSLSLGSTPTDFSSLEFDLAKEDLEELDPNGSREPSKPGVSLENINPALIIQYGDQKSGLIDHLAWGWRLVSILKDLEKNGITMPGFSRALGENTDFFMNLKRKKPSMTVEAWNVILYKYSSILDEIEKFKSVSLSLDPLGLSETVKTLEWSIPTEILVAPLTKLSNLVKENGILLDDVYKDAGLSIHRHRDYLAGRTKCSPVKWLKIITSFQKLMAEKKNSSKIDK